MIYPNFFASFISFGILLELEGQHIGFFFFFEDEEGSPDEISFYISLIAL